MLLGNVLRLPIIAVALIGAVTLASNAEAAPRISFDDSSEPTTGTISRTAGGAVIGTDISFFEIVGVDTPANAGSANRLFCVDGPCLLNFESGAETGSLTNTAEFGSGGSFTLSGKLNTANDGSGTEILDGLILSGSWTTASVQVTPDAVNFSGSGTDEKDRALLDYFGLLDGFESTFNFTNSEISGAGLAAGESLSDFSANVENADLENRANAVPVPATLGLLGVGLLGLGAMMRRRKA